MNISQAETVLSPELLEAYQDADYVVNHDQQAFVIRIGLASPEMDKILEQHAATTMAVISAFNPLSKPADEAINIQNTEKLGNELRSRHLEFRKGLARSRSNQWPEENFIVIGITLDAAKELGRHYHQNAIVFYEKPGIAKLILLR
ncbi:DUF3293 domain-containing protein [Methylobacillus caricis]|uniref:DUF3293 domain-containing protein n=1 Tax=Methylobacillus caricis TaxID=1971611 RepID=UPI001CFF8A84|nr:DUF3293 domain-containing protein [Methylobacillus caricis]MCB5186776.1 DUF3293 domain-containing protein [Methylobacillus caricis]